MSYCTNCGKPLKEGAKFCPSCGAKVIPEEEKPVRKEVIKNVDTSSEKKEKYTKEGRKIIDSGPRSAEHTQKRKTQKVKKKKKRGCLRFFLKTVLVLFVLMIVGVIIIWNLPDDALENSDDNTIDPVNPVEMNTHNSKRTKSKIKIEANDKNIADKYSYGIGVQPDQYKALELYKKAARQGDLNAMIRLSDFYEQGIWVKKDSKKALELLKKAADAGSLEAKWQLEFLNTQK